MSKHVVQGHSASTESAEELCQMMPLGIAGNAETKPLIPVAARDIATGR